MFVISPSNAGFDWTGWLQVIVGALGVYVAARVAIASTAKQIETQRESQRQRDITEATASYIRAIRNLVGACSQPGIALEPYRSAVGTENLLYGMTVRDGLDRDRMYILADVVIKAAGISHEAISEGDNAPGVRKALIYIVSYALIEAIDDTESGRLEPSKLAHTLWIRFMARLNDPNILGDPKICSVMQQTMFPIFEPGWKPK